ncbi:helix-turn-helix transcriptional regulator [Actinokineospora sp. PR83]|uniref:helix-turn-helix domain-containing protein n=1 Tax=Actinokineospora sp. PR83 TaxID=2884908 RepID=UPI001F411BBD|nr:helix-turn-helix transcriptional regulator [Actinokineospora sp. PR83]MCG8920688.1 helix-turn-helix transcriptional regulator [Actinokineospora sp. PR83]
MTSPEHAELVRGRLSSGLRRLRTDARLTGTALAELVGISQSKLSKVETGMALPTVEDVRLIAQETGASAQTTSELVALAHMLHTSHESTRVILHRGAHRRQQEISRFEERARCARNFQITMVPGQLQTEGYMRGCFPSLPEPEVDAAVAARRSRQRILDHPDKEFRFAIAEGAIRWCRGTPGVMAEQVRHLIDLTGRDNITLGVIPWRTPVLAQPRHSFYVYDDKFVGISLHSAYTTLRDPSDVAHYVALFDTLHQSCVHDDEARSVLGAILADYEAMA